MLGCACCNVLGLLLLGASCQLVLCLAVSMPPDTMSQSQLAKHQVDTIARDYVPRWAERHPFGTCPQNLLEIGRAIDPHVSEEDFVDVYGKPIRFACAPGMLAVYSTGEDGIAGTHDDIASWRRLAR